jgi:hypothetical protein
MIRAKLSIFLLFVALHPQTLLTAQQSTHKYQRIPIETYSPSKTNDEAKKDYLKHEKIYIINKPLKEVWNTYSCFNAKEAWKTKRSNYIMSYDTDVHVYDFMSNETYDTLKVGKTYLLQLRLMSVVKMPVVFQISKIDDEEKTIEFTYMEENKSNGFQTLLFSEIDGKTQIIHTSYYKSGKKLRDKKLYPHFHELASDDFHKKLLDIIENKTNMSASIETHK